MIPTLEEVKERYVPITPATRHQLAETIQKHYICECGGLDDFDNHCAHIAEVLAGKFDISPKALTHIPIDWDDDS